MSQLIRNKNNGLYEFPPFVLDPGERRLLRDGKPIKLRAKPFDLLLDLVESAGLLRSRDDLIQSIWPDTIVEEHGLTVGMSALRKVLGDEDDPPRFIETVRGRGYRFVAPVSFHPAADPAADAGVAAEPVGAPPQPWRWIVLAALTLLVAAIGGYVFTAHTGVEPDSVLQPVVADPDLAKTSIVVLPFEHIGEDPGNAFFASGMRQTILARLARIGQLRVISRSSSDSYPSRPGNLKQIGQELGVSSFLEGSVQISGQQVLINMQLIDAATSRHIWADSYTRTLSDVIEIENNVATEVVTALQAHLLPADRARMARAPTNSPEAYVAYLKAGYVDDQVATRITSLSPTSAFEKASALYREAIAKDPNFALAYARLSLLESNAYWNSIATGSQIVPSARTAAQRAIEIDPDLPEAWLAMGYAHYYGERNYAIALKQFERAAELVPHDASVKVALAYLMRRQGKLAAAIDGLKQAQALDPQNPRWPYQIGLTLMAERKYAEADQLFAQALAIEPHNFYCVTYRSQALLLAGDSLRASAVLDEVGTNVDPLGMVSTMRFEVSRVERKPQQALDSLETNLVWVQAQNMGGNTPRSLLEAEAWTLIGDPVRARAAYQMAIDLLKEKLATQPHNPDSWSSLGMAYSGIGARDEAVSAARRATEIVPISRDALDGILYTTVLARVHARLGEAGMAVTLLREMLELAGGMHVSIAMLKNDPDWDRIRDDPSFQRLLTAR